MIASSKKEASGRTIFFNVHSKPGADISFMGYRKIRKNFCKLCHIFFFINRICKDFVFINEPVKEIREEFEKSSMYLMTSRFEGLPMVLLEAQACGLPIVSFNCPEGPADVINDGEDGYLIDDFNKEELVEKTARIALDEQLRKKMGANAFKRSDRFSEESILKKWYYCFEKC